MMPATPGLLPVLLLPLLALGCAADGGEEAAALMQQALASTRASLAMTGQAPAGATASTATASIAPASIAPAVRTAAPQAAWAPGAARPRGSAPPAAAAALVGVTAEQMRRMLGEPAIRRPEGAAEVWLYEAAACRLDVILYAEGAGLVVGHAAARALGGAEGVTEAACLSAVATAPAPAPWGAAGRRA